MITCTGHVYSPQKPMLYCFWCVCLSVRPLKIIDLMSTGPLDLFRVHLSEIMNVCLFVCLFVCLSVRMSVRGFWPFCPPIHLPPTHTPRWLRAVRSSLEMILVCVCGRLKRIKRRSGVCPSVFCTAHTYLQYRDADHTDREQFLQ